MNLAIRLARYKERIYRMKIAKYREKMYKESDIVFGINRDGISIIKNRTGECKKTDIVGVLETLYQYQEEAFKPLIDGLIRKLKVLRPFL